MSRVYVMGSLRNPFVVEVGQALRGEGFEVFDDWSAVGPEADIYWQQYEKARGRTYKEALAGYHAQDVFAFDKSHLDRADIGVLVQPAGTSAYIELGYLVGQGKKVYVLLNGEPERFDIMLCFATEVYYDLDDLLRRLYDDC